MAKNDLILLDEIISKHGLTHMITDEGKNFDIFSSSQILKQYNLSESELASGFIDGVDDGGIDMWYMFMNGHLLNDTVPSYPKANCSLEIILITCKHANEFKQEAINYIYPSITELFDINKSEDELIGKYNDRIKKLRRLYLNAYQNLMLYHPEISFTIYYASRGDSKMVAPNVQARADQLEDYIRTELGGNVSKFIFYGAAELLAAYRERLNFNLTLPVLASAKRNNNNYVALCKLSDFYAFITEGDHLRTYLFDSNVREYLGSNDVNNAIYGSLKNDENIDFWFLNNGITILASNASIFGKTIKIENVQIINGLQTSHAIYRYFTEDTSKLLSDDRAVVVKIISQNEKVLREKIIRSTNNQTTIQLSSLFATDKIQLDIEEYLLKYGYYYERRKNSFGSMVIDESKLFDIMALANGFVCIIGKSPESASRFKQKRLTNTTVYDYIFAQTPLEVWVKIAQVIYLTKKVFRENVSRINHSTSGTYRKMKGIVELLCVARIIGKLDFSIHEFETCDLSTLTNDMILEVWQFVADRYDKKEVIKRGYLLNICIEAAWIWTLTGIPHFVKEKNVLITNYRGYDYIPNEYIKYAPDCAIIKNKTKKELLKKR